MQGRTLLILEQGFMKPRRRKPVHGVELFRMNLVRDLTRLGVRVTLPVERSWEPRLRAHIGVDLDRVRVLRIPHLGGAVMTATAAAIATLRPRHDAVLFGNPNRGLVPAMHIAIRAGAGRRFLVFAHREAHPRLAKSVRRLRFSVVANSAFIAPTWTQQLGRPAPVMYGLTNAEQFHPPHPPPAAADAPRAGSAPDRPVNFCLLARLPSISKGMAMSIEAFTLLPDEVRAKCRLHLASFVEPPSDLPDGVIAHPWMRASDVGEFLRGMDAMLTLSSHETFSQAIVQGMLTGLPIVATPLEVFTEKLDAGGGFVVSTAQEASAAMHRLAADGDLRRSMGEAGRRTALERYVWSTERFVREHLFTDQ